MGSIFASENGTSQESNSAEANSTQVQALIRMRNNEPIPIPTRVESGSVQRALNELVERQPVQRTLNRRPTPHTSLLELESILLVLCRAPADSELVDYQNPTGQSKAWSQIDPRQL